MPVLRETHSWVLQAVEASASRHGIGLGSSIAEVRAAYRLPNVQPGDMVVLQASATAVCRIQLGPDVVTSISLELRTRRCVI